MQIKKPNRRSILITIQESRTEKNGKNLPRKTKCITVWDSDVDSLYNLIYAFLEKEERTKN